MKKIIVLSLVCACGLEFMAGPVNADTVRNQKGRGCTLGKCLSTGDDCLGTNPWEIGVSTESPNLERAYVCEKGYCRGGDIVASKDAEHIYMCIEPGGARNLFNFGNDTWVDYKTYINDCSREHIDKLHGKDIFNRVVYTGSGVEHVQKTIVNSIAGQLYELNDVNNVISVKDDDICFAYVCEYGYVANANHDKCIDGKLSNCYDKYKHIGTRAIDCCLNENNTGSWWDDGINECRCDDPREIWNAGEKRCELPTGACPAGQSRATKQVTVSGCPLCTLIINYCYPNEKIECVNAIVDGKISAIWNGTSCECTNAGQEFKAGKCVAKQQGGLCEQLQKQQGASAQRLACCYAGNATTWSGSNDSTDVKNCVCIDQSKKWDGNKCVDKENTYHSDNSECKYVANSYINCNNGRRIINHSEFTISAAELAGKSCKEFKAGKDMIAYVREKYCGVSGYTEEIPMDAKTKTAISNMEAFFKTSDDDVTVWRNEEGKFNTARLASDATAGVVLGTVGGVVSAKVIKKKQLEKGYDVLKCTIGGQKMADWGDVFNVGFHR